MPAFFDLIHSSFAPHVHGADIGLLDVVSGAPGGAAIVLCAWLVLFAVLCAWGGAVFSASR